LVNTDSNSTFKQHSHTNLQPQIMNTSGGILTPKSNQANKLKVKNV